MQETLESENIPKRELYRLKKKKKKKKSSRERKRN